MSGALDGRCAVITGAGGGLGRTFALGFARAGAGVVAADVDADAAVATCAAVTREVAGARAVAVTVDVSLQESTREMARAAVEAFGTIDALVNNAAVYAGLERRPFHEIEVAEWDRVMAVNLRGPWLCAQACASALRNGGGAIVNVASATVMSGSPMWAHYVASKSGLIGLSRVMARELGDDGVRVNVLAPGFTLTEASRDLIPDADSYGVSRGAIKRSLQPEDIVGTAVFLASDASAMITGQTFVVDGGRQFL
ncbi:MAG TPA: SDR family oxidoreductase [Solirubrobacteraceae bacterium]|nr:SDR family oxidoreductase [Solirubrobacteraceae bacterium]